MGHPGVMVWTFLFTVRFAEATPRWKSCFGFNDCAESAETPTPLHHQAQCHRWLTRQNTTPSDIIMIGSFEDCVSTVTRASRRGSGLSCGVPMYPTTVFDHYKHVVVMIVAV